MTTDTKQPEWYSASSADATHDDQEIDLGDGWWASVADEGDWGSDRWGYELWDHWLRDEGEPVATGFAPDREMAKEMVLHMHHSLTHRTCWDRLVNWLIGLMR